MYDTAFSFNIGYIELLLLTVISKGDCYGYNIYKTLLEITNHVYEIKEATLYSGLRRLEADGFINAYWGDETMGGRRKYYAITDEGRAYLTANINRWNKTKYIVDKIIEWGDKGYE